MYHEESAPKKMKPNNYTYIYVYVYVCVCVYETDINKNNCIKNKSNYMYINCKIHEE